MTQKVIIFCGVDRVGKTTLALKLSGYLNIPYFKSPAPSKSEIVKNYEDIAFNNINLIHSMLTQTKQSIIIDRLIASQYAYSNVLRGGTDVDKIKHYDKAFASDLNTIVVLCQCSFDTLKKRFYEEDVIKYSDIKKIEKQFLDYLKFTKCKVIKINTDTSVESSFSELLLKLKEKTTRVNWRKTIRADGRIEYICEHGIGHGDHVHGCDGCCSRDDFPLKDMKVLKNDM